MSNGGYQLKLFQGDGFQKFDQYEQFLRDYPNINIISLVTFSEEVTVLTYNRK